MSEKKEYIGIFRTSDVKINGKDFIAKIPAGGSELYTRDEAVERIAEAIYAWELDFKPSLPWSEYKKFNPDGSNLYMGRAAAALDALLGGKQ